MNGWLMLFWYLVLLEDFACTCFCVFVQQCYTCLISVSRLLSETFSSTSPWVLWYSNVVCWGNVPRSIHRRRRQVWLLQSDLFRGLRSRMNFFAATCTRWMFNPLLWKELFYWIVVSSSELTFGYVKHLINMICLETDRLTPIMDRGWFCGGNTVCPVL
jgi:hypothetical protein